MENAELIENVAELINQLVESGIDEDIHHRVGTELGITSGDLRSVLEDPEQYALMIDMLAPQLIEKLEEAVNDLENEELDKAVDDD